jgi:four helix bundle protein
MTKPAERTPRIESHRGLRVWQTAMDLVVESYRLVKLLPADERFSLARQITRAAVSVPANIAEGHGRLLRGEFLHHLSIARGSLKELETLLAITERLAYVSAEHVVTVMKLCESVSRMLTRLRGSLRQES